MDDETQETGDREAGTKAPLRDGSLAGEDLRALIQSVEAAYRHEGAPGTGPHAEERLAAIATTHVKILLACLGEDRILTDAEMSAIRTEPWEPPDALKAARALQSAVRITARGAMRAGVAGMAPEEASAAIKRVGRRALALIAQVALGPARGADDTPLPVSDPPALAHLLTGSFASLQRHRLGARSVGLPVGASYVVALVAPAPAGEQRIKEADLARACLAGAAVRGIAGSLGDRGVIVASDADPGALAAAITRRPDVVGGIGLAESGLGGIAVSYAEAVTSFEVATHTASWQPVVTYDLALPNRLLLSDQRSAADLVRILIAPLEIHDAATGSSLTETLDAYVAAGGNASKAAEALFVHRHTLHDRLGKITEYTGRNPQDPDTFVLCALAVISRRLLSHDRSE